MAQAGALYIAGNFGAAEAQIRPLLELAVRTGNAALEIRALHMLGRLEVLRGDLKLGRDNLIRALAGSAGVMNTTEIIVSSDMAAGALSVLGDFETAIAEATEMFRQARETTDPATLAAAQVFLLAIYQHRGMWREAAEIGREAIARAHDAANFIYEYDALAFLGLAVARGGDIEEGIAIQESAIQLAKQQQINLLLGRAYGWLAEIYRIAGRLEESREAARLGMEQAKESGNSFEYALCRRQLGETLTALGEYEVARAELDAAAAEYETEGALPELERTRLALSVLAEATGDPNAGRLAAAARTRLEAMGIEVDSSVRAIG
jgi:tetratricopeptide (TPR) repeat protein